jgi:geranylgeranyl pyrophosphate synthase
MESSGHGLSAFLAAVEARAAQLLDEAPLDAEQRSMLLPELGSSRSRGKPLKNRLVPFYLLRRLLGGRLDTISVEMAAGFLLVQRFASLVDKVEDDDLGGALSQYGSAVVLNGSLVLFVLGLDVLSGIDAGQGAAGMRALRESLRSHLLRMARGQHRELRCRFQLRGHEEVLETASDKAAEFSLMMDFAARTAGDGRADSAVLECSRAIGQDLACMVQIANDLGDLFGAAPSDDLRTGTWNIPLTLFLHRLSADERASWLERLRAPTTVERRALQEALQANGALRELAELSEQARRRIHTRIAGLAVDQAYAAFFLAWLDDLAALFYRPPALRLARDVEDVDPEELAVADRELFLRIREASRAARAERRCAP